MSATTADKTTITLRFLDGSIFKGVFPSNIKLQNMANFVVKKYGEFDKSKLNAKIYDAQKFTFVNPVPPKQTYSREIFEAKTLQELQLVPSASLNVVQEQEPEIKKGEGTIYDAKFAGDTDINFATKLKGDSYEEKQRFAKKLAEEEAAVKKLEMEKKKKELHDIRSRIDDQKEERKDKVWVPTKEKQQENEFV